MEWKAACVALLLSAPPVAAQAAEVPQWTRFVDPSEGAFAVDVPAGWVTSGGLARRNALQMWPWVSAVSPDGSIIVGLGDPGLQSHVLPTQMLAMTGFTEGRLYNGGGGTTYIVGRYQTGRDFAVGYGLSKLSQYCAGVQTTKVQDRADVGRQLSDAATQTTAGEATFTCSKQGVPTVGTLYAATSLFMMPMAGPGAGLWYPSLLAGAVSPQASAGAAASMVAHMLDSYQVSPAWIGRQSQTTMEASRITTAAGHAVSKAITQSWQDRNASMDRNSEAGSRQRLGIERYVNPSTGSGYTVDSQHEYNWVKPNGAVVGTDTLTAPPDATQLQREPPR